MPDVHCSQVALVTRLRYSLEVAGLFTSTQGVNKRFTSNKGKQVHNDQQVDFITVFAST